MLGLFRFRGKTNRILSIYRCFCDHNERSLHPVQISRATGIDLLTVVRTLDQTNELFMKLPGRGDGITRYALPSSVFAMDPAQVELMVANHARREHWVFWSIWASLIVAFGISTFFVFGSMFL
ncbi:MAG: hypothetical protein F4W90_08185 [Gammaproteobacteria bacterium]|nr:hypothetical protein [Gammaproteobacteria bacterium]